MNKQNAKDYLPLVQALIAGKIIQYRVGDDETWVDLAETIFTYDPENYRIKPEPHPAESWPMDAKILVRSNEYAGWTRRYFAKFEDGVLYAWAGGGTSWSSDGDVMPWEIAKLAEADDGQG